MNSKPETQNPKLKVIRSLTGIILLLLGLNGLISGCSKDKGSSPVATNNPPDIQELTANPPEIKVGDTTAVTVKAVDPDGDELSYLWSVGSEILPDTAASISWQATSLNVDQIKVTVTVSDGQEEVSSTVTITVHKATNSPPQIQELTANPSEIEMGGGTNLTVKAVDEEEDELSYLWTAAVESSADTGPSISLKTLPDMGDSIYWKAIPSTFGSYPVKVEVSDGQEEASFAVTVTVLRPAGLSLRLEPGSKQVKVGESFDLEVRVEDVEDLAGISFRLYFEPVIEATGVVWGDFWDAPPIVPLTNFERGMVLVAGGIAQPQNGEKISKDGSWGLAKITFSARTEGTTWLTFYRNTLALCNPSSKPVSGFKKDTIPLGQTQVIVSEN